MRATDGAGEPDSTFFFLFRPRLSVISLFPNFPLLSHDLPVRRSRREKAGRGQTRRQVPCFEYEGSVGGPDVLDGVDWAPDSPGTVFHVRVRRGVRSSSPGMREGDVVGEAGRSQGIYRTDDIGINHFCSVCLPEQGPGPWRGVWKE